MSEYTIEVVRDNKETLGPGELTVFFDGDKVDSFPLITGGAQLDPKQYGGITPPIVWEVTEKIKLRDHPAARRSTMTMSRIVPAVEADREEYSNRTFETHGESAYPFMIHAGSRRVGSSTGCLAILERWDDAIDRINKAYDHNREFGEKLLVDVLDADQLE